MAKKSNFFLATMIGAVAGVVGGLLLAPQSGKKTRDNIKNMVNKLGKELQGTVKDTKEKVQDIFGQVTDTSMEKYKEIKSAVMNKVAEVKTAGKEIDKDKYSILVEDVVKDFKGDFKETKNGATKMVSYLKKDWNKVKKALF
jgi:gas vesicle protein